MRILIAAESPLVRAGIEALLRTEADLRVLEPVGVGGSPRPAALAAALLAAESQRPELILIDLETVPDELPDEIAALAQSAAVVVLVPFRAASPGPGWMAEALRSGVRAILPRDLSPAALIAALHAAAGGLAVLPAEELPTLLPATLRHEPAAADEPLTARELETLRMLAEGLGNKQIAAGLGISEHTVKFHVASILGKLHAGTRTEAVTLAIRRGMIPL